MYLLREEGLVRARHRALGGRPRQQLVNDIGIFHVERNSKGGQRLVQYDREASDERCGGFASLGALDGRPARPARPTIPTLGLCLPDHTDPIALGIGR